MTVKYVQLHDLATGRVTLSGRLLVPSDDLLKNFHEKTEPLFRQKHLLQQQSERLRQTRDLLLPRLISGKLSIEKLDIQFPPAMGEETMETG